MKRITTNFPYTRKIACTPLTPLCGFRFARTGHFVTLSPLVNSVAAAASCGSPLTAAYQSICCVRISMDERRCTELNGGIRSEIPAGKRHCFASMFAAGRSTAPAANALTAAPSLHPISHALVISTRASF